MNCAYKFDMNVAAAATYFKTKDIKEITIDSKNVETKDGKKVAKVKITLCIVETKYKEKEIFKIDAATGSKCVDVTPDANGPDVNVSIEPIVAGSTPALSAAGKIVDIVKKEFLDLIDNKSINLMPEFSAYRVVFETFTAAIETKNQEEIIKAQDSLKVSLAKFRDASSQNDSVVSERLTADYDAIVKLAL